jgi:hypothetical protein
MIETAAQQTQTKFIATKELSFSSPFLMFKYCFCSTFSFIIDFKLKNSNSAIIITSAKDKSITNCHRMKFKSPIKIPETMDEKQINLPEIDLFQSANFFFVEHFETPNDTTPKLTSTFSPKAEQKFIYLYHFQYLLPNPLNQLTFNYELKLRLIMIIVKFKIYLK